MPTRLARLRIIPAIHRATHQLSVHIAASTLGVTQGEAHILQHLASAGPCTIAALHRAFAHRRSTLTSVLDRLVDRGLVTREVGVADRRTFVIALTAPGRRAAAAVHRELRRLESRALAGLSPRDLEGFERSVAGLGRALRPDDDTE